MASPNVSGIMAQLIPNISAGKENIATQRQKRIPFNPGLYTKTEIDKDEQHHSPIDLQYV